jgi:hypothetical protein
MYYVKKPIKIRAIQWKGGKDCLNEIHEAFGKKTKIFLYDEENDQLSVATMEGVMKARIGDYIIEGIQGEYYPCNQDIFEKTYDKADE